MAAEGGQEGPIQFICWGTSSLIFYGTNIDLFASTNVSGDGLCGRRRRPRGSYTIYMLGI